MILCGWLCHAVAGSYFRRLSLYTPFALDAGSSIDNDGLAALQSLQYEWQCARAPAAAIGADADVENVVVFAADVPSPCVLLVPARSCAAGAVEDLLFTEPCSPLAAEVSTIISTGAALVVDASTALGAGRFRFTVRVFTGVAGA